MITGEPDMAAVNAALRVLDDHFEALNAQDQEALVATLHFPHYRLSSGRIKAWQSGDSYLTDFRARAGAAWARSELVFRNIVAASVDKVHVDIAFTRFDNDGQPIGLFRSLWVITHKEGRWAAEFRSSFAR